eukprot:scaffold1044_cov266-Pinguiococcus_pyrenoidosus.AAC.10
METKGFTNATAEFVLPAQVTAGTGADTPDELAVREQAILASIQDLQRQLLEVRCEIAALSGRVRRCFTSFGGLRGQVGGKAKEAERLSTSARGAP